MAGTRGGTVYSVAPLDPRQCLELLVVEERRDHVTREFGRLIEQGRTLLGWGIEVDDIERVAERLGLPVEVGSIANEDGSTGSWRSVDDPADPSLPFFISYDIVNPAARQHRWRERVEKAGNQSFGGFTFVEVGGDREQVQAFLGGAPLPVRIVPGRPGLHAIGISGPSGEIVLRDPA